MKEAEISKVRHIFEGHDIDGSGTIGSKEFGQCLGELNHPLANDITYVQSSLTVVDVDKSGEIEWEEFLMFVAHESGKSVPAKLLPEHMALNQAKIIADYASFKDKTLNDASGSIWDSTDAMSGGGKHPSKPAAPKPAGGGGGGGAAVEKIFKQILQAIDGNGQKLKGIKNILVPP